MQPKLKYIQNEQAHHIYMQGDKKKQLEPPEVILHFPGGQVVVTRCTNGEYWVHLELKDLDENTNKKFVGQIVDARIDCDGLGTTKADLGSLERDDLNHLAIRVRKL